MREPANGIRARRRPAPAGAQEPVALHRLRLGRSRQVDADRPAALRIQAVCSTISSTRSTADSRKYGTQGEELDFALLLDGLAAEREQNITIDVAYRFFATARRKFIVVDAPGPRAIHRATWRPAPRPPISRWSWSSADEGLTRQTRRHALIVSMLGVRHVVLAVNKMDLRRLVATTPSVRSKPSSASLPPISVSSMSCASRSRRRAATTSPPGPHACPGIAGRRCSSISKPSSLRARPRRDPFRMPMQWVNRPDRRFPRL